MKKKLTFLGILAFVRANWFKLTIVGVGLYLFLYKGMTLQVQMHSPEGRDPQFVSQPKEKMTENHSVASLVHSTTNRLELPFFSASRNNRNGLAQLMKADESVRLAFLERFRDVALQEQRKYGIPASIVLAVSLYQSTAGQRNVAKAANNYFALPCSEDWQHACRSVQGTRYRQYESAWYSFRDFSKYLESNFANLRGGNYINFVNALQEAGFGDDAHLAENLVTLIEGYNLQELDK